MITETLTIVKYGIPEQSKRLLQRFNSRVQFDIIKKYHARLSAKHKYLIEPFDNAKGYSNGYYTDATIETIQEIERNGFKLYNCNWNSNRWHIEPLESYYNVNGSVKHDYYGQRSTPLFELGYNRELIGSMLDGVWLYKHAEIKRSITSTNYITYDYKHNTIDINCSNGYYRYKDGVWYGGISYLNSSDPCKMDDDTIKWYIDKLSHTIYNGFYDDVIVKLKDSMN